MKPPAGFQRLSPALPHHADVGEAKRVTPLSLPHVAKGQQGYYGGAISFSAKIALI